MKIDLYTLYFLWREIQKPTKSFVHTYIQSPIMANSEGREDSADSQLSKKEENDMLLYMWQRAAFMDSGQGVPKEMTDSLRLRVTQLGSYHTKM